MIVVGGVIPGSIRIYGAGSDRLSGRLRPSSIKGGIKGGHPTGGIVAPDFLVRPLSRKRRLMYPQVPSWRQLSLRIDAESWKV